MEFTNLETAHLEGNVKVECNDNSLRGENLVLEIKGLSKSFPGVQALANINLHLKRGEILALVGENGAGKSTMMKILAGVHPPDSGEIILEGNHETIEDVRKATSLGIALVHQEMNLCDNLSVAGNIFLGREPKKGIRNRFLDKDEMEKNSLDVLTQVGLDVSPSTLIRDLPIGAQQLVEISKALSINAKIIMFDEPTSSLSEHETARLFKVIRELSAKGVSCIYISHRLGEVKEIADRAIVLRDGKLSGCLEKDEINRDAMIKMMVGREIEKMYQKNHTVKDEVRLELKDFIVPQQANFPVNLKIRSGEIVVLSGLVGAGRTELLHAIFGIDKCWAGDIFVDGKKVAIASPSDAIKAGMVLVPEDRKLNGLIVNMEVDNNIALARLKQMATRGFINRRQVDDLVERMIKLLDIRLYRPSQYADSLSGGNQQKVVLGKWLSMDPALLILDEPTRGIDVGAKAEIYRLLEELADTGVAVLVASSEMQEVLGIADRIIVMWEGKITGELDPLTCGEEDILRLATGGN